MTFKVYFISVSSFFQLKTIDVYFSFFSTRFHVLNKKTLDKTGDNSTVMLFIDNIE